MWPAVWPGLEPGAWGLSGAGGTEVLGGILEGSQGQSRPGPSKTALPATRVLTAVCSPAPTAGHSAPEVELRLKGPSALLWGSANGNPARRKL